MIGNRDVILKQDRPTELLLDKHEKYLKNYANSNSGTEQIMSEYLKMSGMYWGLNALYLMDTLDQNSQEVPLALDFIKQCQCQEGGFSAAPRHDPHILHTLSSVQMLVILKKCHSEFIDVDRCVNYVSSLQQPDGSFFGDKWGEVDTRFSFCGLATLKLLNRLDAINLDKAVEFIMRCNNQIDGGFGRLPGSESHAAYVYCCVGSLAIAGQLKQIPDPDQLGSWLAERQLASGGLNGRPEKLPDLCYSWWCLASMKMINKIHLIDNEKLLNFILACQDSEQGGFSDRPRNWVDPYHTMFGLASMSLISHHSASALVSSADPPSSDQSSDTKARVAIPDKNPREESSPSKHLLTRFVDILKPVNPVLCMPEESLTYLKSGLSLLD